MITISKNQPYQASNPNSFEKYILIEKAKLININIHNYEKNLLHIGIIMHYP